MNKHIETAIMGAIPFIIAWAGGMEFTQNNLANISGISMLILIVRTLR